MSSISFVVTAYNLEKYIVQCVESIINQMHEWDQLIIVDDGSSDASYEICKQYKSNRITVLKTVHQGVVAARKMGLHSATEEYVAFVDGDDYLTSDYRSTIEKCIQDNKPDIVLFGFSTVGGKREFVYNPTIQQGTYVEICIGYMDGKHGSFGTLCNKLFKRHVLEKCQHLWREDIYYGEDSVMAWAALSCAREIHHLSDAVLYLYRQHAESTTHRYVVNISDNMEHVYEALRCIQWPDRIDMAWSRYINSCEKEKAYTVILNETRRNGSLSEVSAVVKGLVSEAVLVPEDPMHKKICNWLVQNQHIVGTYIYIKLYRCYRALQGLGLK